MSHASPYLWNPAKAIAVALTQHGVKLQGEQAKILGLSYQSWSKYVRGQKDPQVSTVAGWRRHAEHDHELWIVLVWTFQEISATGSGPVLADGTRKQS